MRNHGNPWITPYYDGPAIAMTKEDVSHRQDCKLGSQILREACLDLFQRTANRHHIPMNDAMACHLGQHSPARLVRSPSALCIGRMAA